MNYERARDDGSSFFWAQGFDTQGVTFLASKSAAVVSYVSSMLLQRNNFMLIGKKSKNPDGSSDYDGTSSFARSYFTVYCFERATFELL